MLRETTTKRSTVASGRNAAALEGVRLRVLIDKALTRGYVLLPLAAAHHRREGLVCSRDARGSHALVAEVFDQVSDWIVRERADDPGA